MSVEGDPNVYPGRVARLSPAITEGTRTLPIEVEVPNEAGKLRPGTFAKAEIVIDESAGFVVPQSALVVFAGVEKLLIVRDGKAHEQRVRTGRRVGDRVEIVEGVTSGRSRHHVTGRPRRRRGGSRHRVGPVHARSRRHLHPASRASPP